MKTIIGIATAIGVFGGAASLIGSGNAEEVYPQNYMDEVPTEVDLIHVCTETRNDVEYINFTEPLVIKGYVNK
ncbi:MAG: hypothetical protein MK009_05920 [Gammaproteobacteria bacterium]|nr:hypothetical protein [Gammaproteobacteria bacterium]